MMNRRQYRKNCQNVYDHVTTCINNCEPYSPIMDIYFFHIVRRAHADYSGSMLQLIANHANDYKTAANGMVLIDADTGKVIRQTRHVVPFSMLHGW